MAKQKKKTVKKTRAPAHKKKSALPDLISGKYIIVCENSGTEWTTLTAGGRVWAQGTPPDPYIFPSKTHAQAYIDGMSPEIRPEAPISALRLSENYGQSFEIVPGDGTDGPPEKIKTGLCPKHESTTFRQAVHKYEALKVEPIVEAAEALEEEKTAYKLEMKERERAHKERRKKLEQDLLLAEKERNRFRKAMLKLAGK